MEINEIRRTLDLFRTDNGLIEMRIFNTMNKTEIYSGIFDNDESLISEVMKFDRDNYNIYFVFNELKNALSGLPQLNKMIRGAKTVQDKDIKYRRWLLVDVDPIREGGVTDVASTDAEMESARLIALDVRKFLRENGFKQPVVCRSGNGFHLMFKLNNMECNDETDKAITDTLKYVSMIFSNDKADCDIKVGNRARLTKFYSSVSRKGGNTLERPHRKSEIVVIPPNLECTDISVLRRMSQLYDKSQETDIPVQQSYYGNHENKFDLDSFLSQHGIEVLSETKLSNGDTKKILKVCPFNPEHGKDSAIFVSANGAIKFTCFHSSCSGYSWRDLRLKYDPHAYDPKPQMYSPMQPYARPQYQQPAKKDTVVKEETPELGKKWYRMTEIPKVDLDNIVSIRTGYRDIDNNMVGLNLGEITLLSGSNSSGKSSWLNSLILNVVDGGYKVALWSGELVPSVLKTWIEMAAAGRTHLLESRKNPGKFYVPQHIAQRIDEWLGDKFYLYNNEYGSKFHQLFNDMEEMIKCGVKLLILDNLFSMDIDIFDGDKNNKQKELILKLTDFVRKEQVHLILVCHPRKQTDFLRKDSISGTADLGNAASNILICHRVNNDFQKRGEEFFGKKRIEEMMKYSNVIEIAKNRMYGAVDVMCGMYYDIASRRFTNDKDVFPPLGWENNTPQYQPVFETQQVSCNGYMTDNNRELPFMPPSDDNTPF